VIIPVEDSDNQQRLQEILDLNLADDTLAWRQDDAVWTRIPTVKGVSAQKALQELALERARRRREADALAPTRA
jgi:polyphosphate kinase